MKLIIQIALGIVLGAILVWGGSVLIASVLLQQASESYTRNLQTIQNQQQQTQIKKAQEEKAKQERIMAEKPRKTKISAAVKAKQEAFEEWYTRSTECEPSNENPKPDLVKCSNHFIQARSEFEKVYEIQTIR